MSRPVQDGAPSARYRAGVAAGDWQDDPAQHAALAAFDRLWAELAAPPRASLWQRLRGAGAPAPQGIYLWGQVGRGKTFLSELFCEALPTPHKRRVHFHRFMREVHAQLRQLEGRRDPLVEVAARLAAELRVLVLDEFFVGDIGDAMILGNLLQALFARGVVLVTTSNTPPAELYKDGLQRARFLPAIALIERHCEVVELVSAQDWRLRALKQAPVYHTPPGADAERALEATFRRIARGEARAGFRLALNEREIPVRREADDVIWFDFDALCEGPRAVADYIELARGYSTLLISNVPQFTPQTDDAARRFIELVDELYDRGVKLVLSAAAPIVDLYDGERLRAAFARTESRLIEMQSEDYLAREHRP
ncbi:MAG: cell division protein ZapE [Rhodanobacteraceae bacterium]|jgi:cell division protein ZapE|nr:cell division protein ZapE [Rhodanobacteraceae bacterium]